MKDRPFTEILNGLCSATTTIILLTIALVVSNWITSIAYFDKGYMCGRQVGIEWAEHHINKSGTDVKVDFNRIKG